MRELTAFVKTFEDFCKRHPNAEVATPAKAAPTVQRKVKARRKPQRKAKVPPRRDPLLLDPWPCTPQDLPYAAYLLTPHWRRVRTEALRQAEHRCTNPRCRETQPLEVHHLHYRSLWRECANDVLVLCATCHALMHGQYIAT